MNPLVHIYISLLIVAYFFILLIRFWDDIFGESADISGNQSSRFVAALGSPADAGRALSRDNGLVWR